jgi:hypothetical protein
VSSRLDVDRYGNPIVVLTSPQPGATTATTFRVLIAAPTTPPPELEPRGAVGRHRREWTDDDKAEARRLRAEGLSQYAIAARVCGDVRYRTTVVQWLR